VVTEPQSFDLEQHHESDVLHRTDILNLEFLQQPSTLNLQGVLSQIRKTVWPSVQSYGAFCALPLQGLVTLTSELKTVMAGNSCDGGICGPNLNFLRLFILVLEAGTGQIHTDSNASCCLPYRVGE